MASSENRIGRLIDSYKLSHKVILRLPKDI